MSTDTQEPRDSGMTLIEVLVAMGLFSLLGTLLLGFSLSTSRVTEDTRALTNVNEESRLAMERMARELRQANKITEVDLPVNAATDDTAVTFWIDFDGDKVPDTTAVDPEVLTYRYDPVTNRLTLTANDASGTEVTRPVLAAKVSKFDVLLKSSAWQHDANGDGSTTWQELNAAGPPVGDQDPTPVSPDGPELDHIDLVDITMTVLDGPRAQTYRTQVDMRNQS